MMEADDAVELLTLLRNHSIPAWVDGGWGVDALVGRKTRPYESLDLVVPAERIEEIMRPMQVTGYVVVTDELPTRFAMRDAD